MNINSTATYSTAGDAEGEPGAIPTAPFTTVPGVPPGHPAQTSGGLLPAAAAGGDMDRMADDRRRQSRETEQKIWPKMRSVGDMQTTMTPPSSSGRRRKEVFSIASGETDPWCGSVSDRASWRPVVGDHGGPLQRENVSCSPAEPAAEKSSPTDSQFARQQETTGCGVKEQREQSMKQRSKQREDTSGIFEILLSPVESGLGNPASVGKNYRGESVQALATSEHQRLSVTSAFTSLENLRHPKFVTSFGDVTSSDSALSPTELQPSLGRNSTANKSLPATLSSSLGSSLKYPNPVVVLSRLKEPESLSSTRSSHLTSSAEHVKGSSTTTTNTHSDKKSIISTRGGRGVGCRAAIVSPTPSSSSSSSASVVVGSSSSSSSKPSACVSTVDKTRLSPRTAGEKTRSLSLPCPNRSPPLSDAGQAGCDVAVTSTPQQRHRTPGAFSSSLRSVSTASVSSEGGVM